MLNITPMGLFFLYKVVDYDSMKLPYYVRSLIHVANSCHTTELNEIGVGSMDQ